MLFIRKSKCNVIIKRKERQNKNSRIDEELMVFIFNPKNMNKWNDWGFAEHEEMLNFINV